MGNAIAIRWNGTLFHLLVNGGKTACGLAVPKDAMCSEWPTDAKGRECYRCTCTVVASKVRKVYLASK